MSLLELAENVSSIGRDSTETENKKNAAVAESAHDQQVDYQGTNGKIPISARTAGSDKIPSEIVSAIITSEVWLFPCQ